MEKSTKDLIQDLSKNYGPRPWWKNPGTLFELWFAFHFVYFVTLGLLKADAIVLRSSIFYVMLEISGALLSGGLFIYVYRHHELKSVWAKTALAVTVLWMATSVLVENTFMGTILHDRALSVAPGDFRCFWHATISTIGPVLVFPVLFKNFFFARPVWAMTFMSFHLAFLGSVLNELKCPDREFWHLVLGHQTPVIGVGLLMMVIIFFAQKRASLKLSAPGTQKP